MSTTTSPKQSPHDELIGRVINDRFRIISVIARGGMGRVYRAEQVPLGRLVAVKTLDPRSLIAADFMILATSLPKKGYSARAVLAVYRLRWQIELAFKRLKSLLHIDRLPTWTERGSRSWLYAHLILALLCDDLSQDFLDSSP